jgi:hypothetical protein
MKSYQVSFFDESQRLAASSRLNDPLEVLAKRIDFEMICLIFKNALHKADRNSPTENPRKWSLGSMNEKSFQSTLSPKPKDYLLVDFGISNKLLELFAPGQARFLIRSTKNPFQ